jgi:hypothetical protein
MQSYIIEQRRQSEIIELLFAFLRRIERVRHLLHRACRSISASGA